VTDVDESLSPLFDRLIPEPAGAPNWEDALGRARAASARRRRTIIFAAAAAVLCGLATAAFAGGLGGFSAWLNGLPGTKAPGSIQRKMESLGVWNFPGPPALRQLIRVEERSATFTLYGFRNGNLVCLRLVPEGVPGSGSSTGCLSTGKLRRSTDLIIPMRGDARLRNDSDGWRQGVVTFGFAAEQVQRVEVNSDEGSSEAALAGGAFLDVLRPKSRWTRMRETVATDRAGRRQIVPIWVSTQGEPPVVRPLPAKGPSRVDRRIPGRPVLSFLRAVSAAGGFQFVDIDLSVQGKVAGVELFLATGETQKLPVRSASLAVRLQLVKLPARFAAYDRKGRVIGLLTFPDHPEWDGRPGPIPSHVALDAHTAAGEIIVRAGPYRRGGTCYSIHTTSSRLLLLRFESHRFAHCVPALRPNEVLVQGEQPVLPSATLVFGRVGRKVASVEFRLSDGSRRIVRTESGFLVLVHRHRDVAYVARDAQGTVISKSP
jgi:hypothetical protein